MTDSSSNDEEHRVINLHGRPRGGTAPPSNANSPAAQEQQDRDDYRHRMIVNLVGLGFIVALIVAGIWLANMMAQTRKVQDCIASGRRNCVPIEQPRDRW